MLIPNLPKIFILTLLLPYCINGYSQNITFGQTADVVKSYAETQVNEFYNSGANGTYDMAMKTQTKYNNDGHIVEVQLYKLHMPDIQLQKRVDCCIRYVMSKEILTKIIFQYRNVTVNELKIIAAKHHILIGQYYFDANFEHYQTIHENPDGTSSVTFYTTDLDALPKNIRDKVISEQNIE